MTNHRLLFAGMALALLLGAAPAMAQEDCTGAVVNYVAVQFTNDDPPIVPRIFTLVATGLQAKVKRTVINDDVYWLSKIIPKGLVGVQYAFTPDFTLPGYKVEAAEDVDQDRIPGSGRDDCQAIYTFKLTREKWALEIRPTPPQPYSYQMNSVGKWNTAAPDPKKSDWMRVWLGMDDRLYIRIFEGTRYLFEIRGVKYKSNFVEEYDQDRIVQEILDARIPYKKRPAESPFAKDDPYMPVAMSVSPESGPSWFAARGRIIYELKLQLENLTLSDKTGAK